MSFVDHVVLLELPECTFGCCALGDSIIAADTAEDSLAENFHGDADASTIGELFGFSVEETAKLSAKVVCDKENLQLTRTLLFPVRVPAALESVTLARSS
jgi:hypothetical protein